MEQQPTNASDGHKPASQPRRAQVALTPSSIPLSPGSCQAPSFVFRENDDRQRAAAAQLVPARRVPRPDMIRRAASESPDAFAITRSRRQSTDFGEQTLSSRTVEVPRGDSLERARNHVSDPELLRRRLNESQMTIPVDGSRRNDLWTEIRKDLVTRDAIVRFGYEFEETEHFFYLKYLQEEDLMDLIRVSDEMRRRRKEDTSTVRVPSPSAKERVQQWGLSDGTDGKNTHHVDEYVWDVSSSRDRTIHLNLELVEDAGSRLDEILRLTRLGHFKAAMEFFDVHLRKECWTPYIFVQYARLLLRSTEYKTVMTITAMDDLDHIPVLKMSWDLIKLNAEVHQMGANVTRVKKAILDVGKLVGSWPQDKQIPIDYISSTEIQIISLALNLMAQYPELRSHDLGMADSAWPAIYQTLLAEERVWEFRDLFVSTCSLMGYQKTFIRFFGPSVGAFSVASLRRLTSDWLRDAFDEPTSLALLDILAEIGFGMAAGAEDPRKVDVWLHYSQGIASDIAKEEADLLRTGPYLRWSLAKVHLATCQKEQNGLNGAPELLILPPHQNQAGALDLPIYAPTGTGDVNWKLPVLPSYGNSSIQVVLDVAHALGDWETETMCHKMLLRRSQDPFKHLDQLFQLQKDVQNDQMAYLVTLLFSYNLADTEATQKALRRDILDIESWEDFPVTLQWARFMILRAVSAPRHAELWLRSADDLYDSLPRYVQRGIKRPPVEARRKARGKTRFPAHMVSLQAVIASGYPYSDEGNTIVIYRALKQEEIEELLELTERYRADDEESSPERYDNRGPYPSYRWNKSRFSETKERRRSRHMTSPPTLPEQGLERKQIADFPWNEARPEDQEQPKPTNKAALATEFVHVEEFLSEDTNSAASNPPETPTREGERCKPRGRSPWRSSVSPTKRKHFQHRNRGRKISHERSTPQEVIRGSFDVPDAPNTSP